MDKMHRISAGNETVQGAAEARRSASISTCLLASALLGLVVGLIAWMSGLGPFWSFVTYLVTGQVLFGLACIRLCMTRENTGGTYNREIEADLSAMAGSRVGA